MVHDILITVWYLVNKQFNKTSYLRAKLQHFNHITSYIIFNWSLHEILHLPSMAYNKSFFIEITHCIITECITSHSVFIKKTYNLYLYVHQRDRRGRDCMVAGFTTAYASSAHHRVHSDVYSMQHYVIKFFSDLRQVGGFLRVFQFPHLTAPI